MSEDYFDYEPEEVTAAQQATTFLREQMGEGWGCRICGPFTRDSDHGTDWVARAGRGNGNAGVDVEAWRPDPMSAARACVEARDAAGFSLPVCFHCGERRLYRSLYTPAGSHATFGKNPPNTRCAYCDDWLGWVAERAHADRLAEALRRVEYGQPWPSDGGEIDALLVAHDARRAVQGRNDDRQKEN